MQAFDLTPGKLTWENCGSAGKRSRTNETKSRFSEEQIIGTLREAQGGGTVKAVCASLSVPIICSSLNLLFVSFVLLLLPAELQFSHVNFPGVRSKACTSRENGC